MPIRLDGSTGITVGTAVTVGTSDIRIGDNVLNTSGSGGIDGSASTPALQGSDSNTGIFFGTDEVSIATGGTTRATVDSAGRLLVGISSTSTDTRLLLQGTSSNSSAGAFIHLQRGALPTGAGAPTGRVLFADNSSNVGAWIDSASDGAWTSGSSHPGRLLFSTTASGASSPTERMRIGSDGLTSFFGSTVIYSLSTSAAGTSNAVFVGRYSATTGNPASGTNGIIIFNNGNVANVNNSYGSLSDIKLKENIVDANSQWDDLKALQVRNYNFKEGQTHTQIGLIAQEVELVSPGLVTESPDRDEEGNDLGTVTKSVNYSVLYMKAIKALQEAQLRIETLESENETLKNNFNTLEDRIAALEGN